MTLAKAGRVAVLVATAAASLLPHSYIPPGGRAQLQILEEVLQGPIRGRPIVLYLDPATALQVMALSVLRRAPCTLVSLETSGAEWSLRQPIASVRAASVVHVAVFSRDPRPFFRAVVASDSRWNPKYLLLFSLSRENFVSILEVEEFGRPQTIVLFQRVNSESDKLVTGNMEMLTFFPFSLGRQVKSLGVWTSVSDSIFVDRFPSFEGYMFLLGTWFDDFPYLHQAKEKEEGVGDGVEVEALSALASVLNFTFHLTTEPPDDKWGSLENGSWTGMLGMVHRKEKNFTVNYFGYTYERIEAFDATVSYWMEGFGMALLKPPPMAKWRSVYYPFPPKLWAATAASLVIAIVVVYLQNLTEIEFVECSSPSSWLNALRPLVNHALPHLPKAQGKRIFVVSWWLGCFILTTAYTANLIAFITIPAYPERLQTVEQLAQSAYRMSMFDYGEFVPGALKSSKDPHYRSLGKKLDLYPTYDEAIYAVVNGTHAYIESFSYNRILLFDTYKMRNTFLLREQLYPGHLCWYFQKNTAWKYKFDWGIQRLVEAGLIAHWIKIKTEDFMGIDYERRLHLEEREVQPSTILTLQHTQGLFFVLVLGWLLSALSLAIEWLQSSRFFNKSLQLINWEGPVLSI